MLSRTAFARNIVHASFNVTDRVMFAWRHAPASPAFMFAVDCGICLFCKGWNRGSCVKRAHNTETLTDSGNILFTKHDGKTSIPKPLKLFLANKIFRLYFTVRYEYILLVCMLVGRFEMRQCLLGSAFPRLEVCNAQRLRYWFSGERTLVGENRSSTLPLNLIRVCVCVS